MKQWIFVTFVFFYGLSAHCLQIPDLVTGDRVILSEELRAFDVNGMRMGLFGPNPLLTALAGRPKVTLPIGTEIIVESSHCEERWDFGSPMFCVFEFQANNRQYKIIRQEEQQLGYGDQNQHKPLFIAGSLNNPNISEDFNTAEAESLEATD